LARGRSTSASLAQMQKAIGGSGTSRELESDGGGSDLGDQEFARVDS